MPPKGRVKSKSREPDGPGVSSVQDATTSLLVAATGVFNKLTELLDIVIEEYKEKQD